jgi:CSLREA domain-containing protein
MKGQIALFVLFSLVILSASGLQGIIIAPENSVSIEVDSFDDDTLENGNCTLREAILAANHDSVVDACLAGSGKDTILLKEGVYTLTIAGDGEDAGLTGDLDITDHLVIIGRGKDLTFIDGGGLDRVLHIQDMAEVEVVDVTIQNGDESTTGGGGIYNQGVFTIISSSIQGDKAVNQGGGILNSGEFSIFNSTIRDNEVTNTGNGGGIYNLGDLTLAGSTVMNNSAYGRGGIGNSGTLTATNSTISGNQAAFMGGIGSDGNATLNNVTVYNNTAVEAGSAGGIEGNAIIRNSIVADNPGGNCLGSIASAGYNLESEDSCNFTATGDHTNSDTHLGILSDYGGPTFTHALLAGSPAIDAGSCSDSNSMPILTDQRGVSRPQGPGCDIGAFEGEVPFWLLYLPVVVNPPFPIEAVVTSRGETIGYPTTWWVYGYANNPISKTVYSVTIGIDVTYYPYCDPNPCDPYETTEVVKTAFPATLPGQPNPFSWSLLLGKASATVGQVRIILADINGGGPEYYPLTVLNWHREDHAVAGRVRNDGEKDLENARVVVFSNDCGWREAALANTSLQSGQESDFNLDYFYCLGDDVNVIGQGRIIP